MRQSGITILTPIVPDLEHDLRTLLNGIGTNIDTNGKIDFYALSTVHFMRWVILPAQTAQGVSVGPQLALSTNFDGDPQAHLLELASTSLAGIQEIYAHCENFPKEATPAQIVTYWEQHQNKNAAFYVGHVGRAVGQIQSEASLRDTIEDHLQASQPSQNWQGQPAQSIRAKIVAHIRSLPAFAWAQETYTAPFMQRFGRFLLVLLGISIVTDVVLSWVFVPWIALGATIALAIFLVYWRTTLKKLETADTENYVPVPRDHERVMALTEREDFRIQNQITHLVTIKPGKFRLNCLKFVLWAVDSLAKTMFNKGSLGGIPSIHFARWAIIDGGKRLLFFSNYDGSLESYLGDFIDKSALGLTGVWSNTEGFPPTSGLFLQGARNSDEFKAWVREKQIVTQVWYSAYKTLTVQNINQNTVVRTGLKGNLSESKSAEWLQKL